MLIRKGIFDKELFKVEMDSFQFELNGMKNKDPHIEFLNGDIGIYLMLTFRKLNDLHIIN